MLNQELLADFVADMREVLDAAEKALLSDQLSASGSGKLEGELLNEIFRAFHTVKGTSGFFQLTTIVRVAHQAETLLDELRSGRLRLEPGMESELLHVCDFLRGLVEEVALKGNDSGKEEAASAIVSRLRNLLSTAKEAAPSVNQAWGLFEPLVPQPAQSAVTPEMLSHFRNSARQRIQNAVESLVKFSNGDESEADNFSEILEGLAENCELLDLRVLGRLCTACVTLFKSIDETTRVGACAILHSHLEGAILGLDRLPDESGFSGTEELVRFNAASPAAAPTNSPPDESRQVQERQDIRIATTKLDAMMNLVGELVVAEALVTQHKDLQDLISPDFFAAGRQLGKIVRHLQEVALSMRMVPLTAICQRMTRLVWDLSRKSGKEVSLDIEGEDTEVDKSIAELLADPLVHILRNSVDHGLETPEDRLAAGKSKTGTISMKARHSGSEVQISIHDDGQGLNRSRILKRAQTQGLIQGTGDEMTDAAVWELIFTPGFSTADKVTDISGRGVGMDVVRNNVSTLNGRIDVRSEAGRGTTFILRIPLTLAIIEGLVARIGNTHFIIPTSDIVKSIQYSSVNVTTMDRGERLADYRGEFFPVLSLAAMLSMPGAIETLSGKSLIVQVGHEGKSVGIMVDELLGNQHIVVKPLTGIVKSTKGISGCTILGDGSVALIMDVGYMTQTVSQASVKKSSEAELVHA